MPNEKELNKIKSFDPVVLSKISSKSAGEILKYRKKILETLEEDTPNININTIEKNKD